MKVPLNWAQHYANVPLNEIGTEELLKKMGAQLGAIEEVIDFGPRYDGIVVAKVVVCTKHADADRLNVCKINDGGAVEGIERDENGLVQVVCGAPNVREGMLVAWLPPGVTVPSTVHDAEPFVLSAREIRGQVSNGMLASPKELGISDDHAGILEIRANDEEVGDELAKPGTPFKKLYGLDDVVIDCENKMFTHRPDCFGVLGVARELAGIQQKPFTSPEWYLQEPEFKNADGLALESSIADENLCSRIMFVAMKNVTVGPSPLWMQVLFSQIGIRPINNIVDLTNYYMYLTGQPIHAYDYDKIKSVSTGDPVMVARPSVRGETVALLNGKTVELAPGTPVISTDTTVVGIAGIMGGSETEVDETTKNIIIEVGTFDMYTIRRTSMQYGLFTDAVTRFTKGQSPLQNSRVLAKLLKHVAEAAGGEQASPVLNKQAESVGPKPPVTVSVGFINTRLGSELDAKAIASLLHNVEINTTIKGKELTVTPPFWRTDLEYPEDIVEEIGRLYGFDRLPVALPARTSKAPAKNRLLDWKTSIRSSLARLGANELLTYTFVHSDLLARAGLNTEHVFHVRNALSPDLQYYRLTLLPSLLDKVHPNIKSDRVQDDGNAFAIFELNKVHIRGVQDEAEPRVPAEHEHLALVFAADDKTAAQQYGGAAFYQAAEYVRELFGMLGIEYKLAPAGETHDSPDPVASPFDTNRTAAIVVGGAVAGFVGEFNAAVEKAFKLPAFSAGFEVNVTMLLAHKQARRYVTLPSFPKTEQDITFEVAAEIPFHLVEDSLNGYAMPDIPGQATYFRRIKPRDIFATETGSRRITFRIWLARYDRTLQTAEVNDLLADMAAAVNAKTGAVRI